jgi:hypothetical protein
MESIFGNGVALPSPGQRWTVQRKAAVVEAVRKGRLTLAEACQRYSLSPGEFAAWHRAIEEWGVPGLRATRFHVYHESRRSPTPQKRPRKKPPQPEFEELAFSPR